MLEAKFNAGPGKARVSHWACCLEEHQEGGFHYHVSLKLSAPKKWLMVKNTIAKEHNVTVHLSDNHDNYIAAYKYVCKTDNQVFHSVSHPDFSEIGSPKTKNSTQPRSQALPSCGGASSFPGLIGCLRCHMPWDRSNAEAI